jgi:hypothetical protein
LAEYFGGLNASSRVDRSLVVAFVEAQGCDAHRTSYDYLWCTPGAPREDPCAGLM